jgi:hypothetical protein
MLLPSTQAPHRFAPADGARARSGVPLLASAKRRAGHSEARSLPARAAGCLPDEFDLELQRMPQLNVSLGRTGCCAYSLTTPGHVSPCHHAPSFGSGSPVQEQRSDARDVLGAAASPRSLRGDALAHDRFLHPLQRALPGVSAPSRITYSSAAPASETRSVGPSLALKYVKVAPALLPQQPGVRHANALAPPVDAPPWDCAQWAGRPDQRIRFRQCCRQGGFFPCQSRCAHEALNPNAPCSSFSFPSRTTRRIQRSILNSTSSAISSCSLAARTYVPTSRRVVVRMDRARVSSACIASSSSPSIQIVQWISARRSPGMSASASEKCPCSSRNSHRVAHVILSFRQHAPQVVRRPHIRVLHVVASRARTCHSRWNGVGDLRGWSAR